MKKNWNQNFIYLEVQSQEIYVAMLNFEKIIKKKIFFQTFEKKLIQKFIYFDVQSHELYVAMLNFKKNIKKNKFG